MSPAGRGVGGVSGGFPSVQVGQLSTKENGASQKNKTGMCEAGVSHLGKFCVADFTSILTPGQQSV